VRLCVVLPESTTHRAAMSKKVIKKKVVEPAPQTSGGNVSGSGSGTVAVGKANAETDVRVAQQLRVLEVVGAGGRNAGKDDKKYSPRTEGLVSNLLDILDPLGLSRADIAALVRRCHCDENQIQVAVANLIEDRSQSEPTEWGTVKNKKQQKEERRIQEEEDRRDKDRKEKEDEKQKKEAEKQATKEAARQAYAAKEAVAHGGQIAALPPDPAILFAGANPSKGKNPKADDQWWEGDAGGGGGGNGKWNGGEDGDWDWGWKNSWAKGGDWSNEGEWQEVGNSRDKRGGKGKENKEDNMWDMPDVAAPPEGGLDQWALGDIRAHERRIAQEGGELASAGNMRTVEEIEREQLGAAAASAGDSAVASRIDALLQADTAHDLSLPPAPPAPVHLDANRQDRGKGKDKGKGDRGEKGKKGDEGKGRVDRGDRGDRERRPEQEQGDRPSPDRERRERRPKDGEGGDEKERIEKLDRSDDPRRQAVEETGVNVTVKKHSSMGCAVVTLRDARVREAVLRGGTETIISNIRVQMKAHMEKDTQKDVPTDIFVAWGRQVEKTTPLSERELVKHFDQKHQEFTETWRREAEEQQQAAVEQREREEQRQRFEAEVTRRRAAQEDQQRQMEAQQRQQQEQNRLVEDQRTRMQRENQAKYINGLQGNWAHAGGVPGSGPAPDSGACASSGAARDPRVAATPAGAQAAQAAQGAQGAQAAQTAQGAQGAQAAQAGLNPQAAAAYPQAAQWNAQQAQQWMQAMYAQQAQGWQQQQQVAAAAQQQQQLALAAAAAQQRQQGMVAGGMNPQAQDYETQLRAQAQAYYAYMAEQQQRQGGVAAAAYAQQQQAQHQHAQQQQGGYNAQGAAYGAGYGGAAAYGRGGERI